MELNTSHKRTFNIVDRLPVEVSLAGRKISASVRKVSELLDVGSGIICLTDLSENDGNSILSALRDELPGFVASLDSQDPSDLSVALAKSLSLGFDESDKEVLCSRWNSFVAVTKRSGTPFTLVILDADSLVKSRFAQILELLYPLNGRLVLAGCSNVARLVYDKDNESAAAVPDSDARPVPNIHVSHQSDDLTQSTPRFTISEVLPESRSHTDLESPADIESAPQPESKNVSTSRRVKHNKRPVGWLVTGLGLGVVMGALVATSPVLYAYLNIDKFLELYLHEAPRDSAVHSDEVMVPSIAKITDERNAITNKGQVQRDISRAVQLPASDAIEHSAKVQPVLPNEVISKPQPALPLKESTDSNFAALEKSPVSNHAHEVDTKAAAVSANNGSGAARLPTDTADGALQNKTSEPEADIVLSPKMRAHIAEVQLERAKRARFFGDLQKSLLEVARGLDASPNNVQLQKLRQELLVQMEVQTYK